MNSSAIENASEQTTLLVNEMNEISGDEKESAISKELPEKEQLQMEVEKESALGERQEKRKQSP